MAFSYYNVVCVNGIPYVASATKISLAGSQEVKFTQELREQLNGGVTAMDAARAVTRNHREWGFSVRPSKAEQQSAVA